GRCARPLPGRPSSQRDNDPQDAARTRENEADDTRPICGRGPRRHGATTQPRLARGPQQVPTSLGFWAPWLPCSLPPIWPFCWWVAVVVDEALTLSGGKT